MGERSPTGLAAWQRLLLPIAAPLIIGMALFFTVASTIQFYDIMSTVKTQAATAAVAEAIEKAEKGGGANTRSDYLEWKINVLMQDQAQQARASRASSTLLVSLWTRNLGFMTGMILSIFGATFIMWRLTDGGSEISAASTGVNASLKTASPGIVLTALGTLLMGLAMSISYSEAGSDQFVTAAGAGTEATAPVLPDERPSAPGRFPSHEASATSD